MVENTKCCIKHGISIDGFPLDGLGDSLGACIKKFESINRKYNPLIARAHGIGKGQFEDECSCDCRSSDTEFMVNDKRLLHDEKKLWILRDFDQSSWVSYLLVHIE